MKTFGKFTAEAAAIISRGGIGVIPTDTIYGIVCSALSKKAVERVYRMRKRNTAKPVIVLINSLRDLGKFGVKTEPDERRLLGKIWPGPVSAVLPCRSRKFSYIHRGRNTIAFRIPDNKLLLGFLKRTGPVIAPSANFEGDTPATTVAKAVKYFGEGADFYIDTGKLVSKPSTVISFKKGKMVVLRKGAGSGIIKNVSAR